ncbi:hypothetical protein VP1G_08916 [Cytospora mali]|uniref:Arylsulfotransferase n=1 Tax=Cytospora mali TaxID=578113 RepID=A0A194VDC5_CYTMA|nr:hypothetical protein VP1G_08916 [Valsa mali var. pyri (nom. inval.)]
MILSPIWVSFAAAVLLTQPACGDFISTDYDDYNDGKLGHRPDLHFRSSEEYSPVLQVNVWNESAISKTGSHIFLRHDGNESSALSSPLVLDARDLSVVFMNRTFKNVFGTRVQENFGRKYLTFWEGNKGDGVGDGYGLVYDDTYRLVHNISVQNVGIHSDLHEFALTGHGTALVTGVDKVVADTSSWEKWNGVPEYRVLDALFQEIDLETNKVLFSWRALDHIDPMNSHERMAKDWDIYHMNSVQKTQSGNYLVSMRHLHSIFLIDGKTGDIIWTLGGKLNDFIELDPAEGADPLAPLLSMGWQHHAMFLPGTNDTEMTLFDNHVKFTAHGVCKSDCSRGLRIAIDDKASPRTVQLLREYQHPSRLQAQSQGSVQALFTESGVADNIFIGWGRCPSFTEHTPDGETVMDVQFSPWHSTSIPDALDNYRAYKMDWVATPWWDPAIALRNTSEGDLAVYVSWNGATEVREWVVRGGERKGDDDILAVSMRTGFETRMTVEVDGLRWLWAEALDKEGSVLRSTEVLDLYQGDMFLISEAEESDDGEGFDLISPPRIRSTGWSASTWAWLVGGLIGLALTIVAGVFIWRRRGYARLGDDDLDS